MTGVLLLVAVAASAAAGVVHIANAPVHFDESWTHGAFFAAAGLFQIAWAIAAARRPRPAVLRLGLLNVVIVAVWVVSRTVGIPLDADPERIAFADATSTALALVVIAVAAVAPAAASLTLSKIGAAAVLAIGGLAAYGVTPAASAHEHGAQGDGDSHGAGGAVGQPWAAGASPCERSGPPASPAQVTDAEGHSHRGPMRQKPVDAATRDALAAQQVQARGVVDRYPTVAAAEAAGYHMSTPFVPCIGAHYTNPRLIGRFDPSAPSELLFEGTAATSKIIGLSYLVYNAGGAPEGFAGPNDIWHQHNANGGLCLKGGVVVGSEEMSEKRCTEAGGRKTVLTDIWMLHDWVVPGWDCSWGVFAPECPELGGRVGGTAWDAPDRTVTLSEGAAP